VTIAVFPVQGQCNFVDTWHAPRGGGRKHLGVDIIAPEGKLIYAAVDGTITKIYREGTDRLAGNGFRLTAADGTYFFYGHLRNLADGVTVGTKVKAGQVLGFNGRTGDTNTPHLHFEVHPRGGEAVNPYFIVKSIDACNVTEPRPAA
jgi:murein DD-endopeptidase MepM/ murein hydrolase activator NlpD